MTAAGEAVLRVAEGIDEAVLGLEREILGQDLRLQGPIHLTAPEGIATILLPPLMQEFRRGNPEVTFDVKVTNAALELSRREADIAIRVTNNPPDISLGRRVCRFRFCLYGSRAYLRKHGDRDLVDHDWLMTDMEIAWLFPLVWKKAEEARERIILASSSTMVAIEAAKKDMGVILLPCFWGDQERKLVRVVDPIESLSMDLWVLTHPDLRHTARVRAFMSFLFDSLDHRIELIEGRGGA